MHLSSFDLRTLAIASVERSTQSHLHTESMSESLAAFRTGRSKELAQLAEDHINHEYVLDKPHMIAASDGIHTV
jgi:hypothetical protein